MSARFTDLWCFRETAPDGTARLRHFFRSQEQVKMCGSYDRSDPPIVRVRVAEIQPGESSPYYGWWSNEHDCFSMVFGSRTQSEICFAYGSKAEEDRGRGHQLNVTVTELPAEGEQVQR